MSALQPVRFERQSPSQLKIVWNDGRDSLLDFSELRFQCRCAECVDEWTRVRRVKREQIPANIHPLKLELVGRYAVQIDWSDGHRAGIYPFEMLKEITQ